MAEEDEVDILGDFDNGDLLENNTEVPDSTEIGFGLCNEAVLPGISQGTWTFTNSVHDKWKTEVESLSPDRELPSSNLPQKTPTAKNRKQPWCSEERALFEKGMGLYGRRWTKISRLIGTRTTLQVKNYATHYFKMLLKAESNNSTEKNNGLLNANNAQRWALSARKEPPQVTHSATLTCMQRDTENENDEVDVVVDVLSDDQRLTDCLIENSRANDSVVNYKFDTCDVTNLCHGDFGLSMQELSLPPGDGKVGLLSHGALQRIPELPQIDNISSASLAPATLGTLRSDFDNHTTDLIADQHCTERHFPESNNSSAVVDYLHENMSPLDENNQELVFDPPTQEMVLDRLVVTDEEKEYHREFFEGRYPKTPERYIKIRNYILDMWEKFKPKYLNKTCVRSGLRNCGDVNSIGRIHTFLEMRGAINFGCEQAAYNRPVGFSSTSAKTNKVAIPGNLKEIVGSRKRKSPFESPFTVFEGGQGGVTIEHTDNGDKVVACPEAKSVVKPRANPFRLIPCASFSPDSEAPYSVVLHAEAVVVMDIHAHTSNTEVIGLLGGFYNVESHQLEIVIAKPCHSLSTGRQCEMDPVSQTEASQSLEGLGLAVVGWYHSHPTFLPHPSLRDLETQAKYQEWFGQHRNPFVAVIVSPYSGPLVSKILCMIVGDATEGTGQRQPFQLTTTFNGTSFRPEQCLTEVATLLRDFVEEATAVAMDTAFAAKPEYTLLKKMLASVESHLTKAEVMSHHGFLESVLQLMTGKDAVLLFEEAQV